MPKPSFNSFSKIMLSLESTIYSLSYMTRSLISFSTAGILSNSISWLMHVKSTDFISFYAIFSLSLSIAFANDLIVTSVFTSKVSGGGASNFFLPSSYVVSVS